MTIEGDNICNSTLYNKSEILYKIRKSYYLHIMYYINFLSGYRGIT